MNDNEQFHQHGFRKGKVGIGKNIPQFFSSGLKNSFLLFQSKNLGCFLMISPVQGVTATTSNVSNSIRSTKVTYNTSSMLYKKLLYNL